MTETVMVVLVVAVVVLIVAVVLQARRRSGAGAVSADELRAVVASALADRAGVDRAATAQQVADAPGPDVDHAALTAEREGWTADRMRMRAELDVARAEQERANADRDRTARELAAAQHERNALQDTSGDLTRRSTEATERLAAERAEIRRARAELDTERRRSTDQALADARGAVATERAEVENAQLRLQSARDALADDQRRLATDRERTRSDETEIERAREKIAASRESVGSETERLVTREAGIDERTRALDDREVAVEGELSRISGLTPEHARAELMDRERERSQRDAALMVRAIEAQAESTAKQKARAIVADAIQRVASDQTAQTVVSVLHLPSDDVKGRIIGREGRNIRTFESITGVNVIIDDTPEAVLLSCFDPVRREIGRVTLESLIEDGRIHPHRIEEAYLRAHDEVEARCARAAEDALLEVGLSGLHPELQKLVGQLKYRTSYGQNVLGHLVETAHIAGGMASELGLDPKIVIRGAFLHDIGKALTHEAQGSHAIVGAELARRYGESDDVAHCIEAHHDEVAPATVEAVLTQAADSCSGGRPGARRESLESYVQRLERIEAIASAKKGVEKVFAMQAGRELRVMVKPDVVDDLEAHVLAREVAKQIEEELTYPGQVRVTVIRESRATEVAR